MKDDLTTEDRINTLLDKLNVEYEAERIPIIVEDFSEPQQCFGNVANKVKKDGGRLHAGWLIHADGKFLVEAERHVVWENEKGELIDITPQEANVKDVLFVSDDVDNIKSCRNVDNVRINKTGNPLVDDFIKVCETLTAITSLGERIDDYRVVLDNDIVPYVSRYGIFKNCIYDLLCKGGTKKSLCFCGRGQIYDQCHGKGLTQMCNRELDQIKRRIYRRNKNRN